MPTNKAAGTGRLKGRYEDNSRPVQPIMCELSRKDIGLICRDEILSHLPREDRKWFEEKHGNRWRSVSFRHLIDNPEDRTDLTTTVQLIREMKYTPQVLLTRTTAADAYRLLVGAIGVLGPAAPQSGYVSKDAGFYAQQLEQVQDACESFAGLLKPCAAVAYFRNCRQNRTYPLYDRGLLHPAARGGFGWQPDLLVQTLQDDGASLVRLLEEESGGPAWKRFLEREQVRRVLSIRLHWDRSAVQLLLLSRVDPAGAPRSSRAGDPCATHFASIDPRSIELAARYFTGWLGATRLDVSQMHEERPEIDPHDLLCHVGRAVAHRQEKDPERRGADLVTAIDLTLKREKQRKRKDGAISVQVHWTNTEPVGEHAAHELLQFTPGKYDGKAGISAPAFPLRVNPATGTVDRSVCAQAGVWQVSMRIPDIDAPSNPWHDRQVKRTDFDGKCKSELAVPILDRAGIVLGVADVECARNLTEDDRRRAELVILLYERLLEAAAHAQGTDDDQGLLEELTNPVKPLPYFQHLCKQVCQWVCEKLSADLVYLSVFDGRVHIFRPMGITVSEDNARAFLLNEEEVLNLGRKAVLGKGSPVLKTYEAEGPEGVIHALIEHTVANRLLPSPDGHTTQIWQSRTPYYQPDINSRKAEGGCDPAMQAYARTVIGLPFQTDAYAAPDGVLWIGWRRPPAKVSYLAEHLKNEPKFIEAVLGRLGPIPNAVAAMYAFYRYCDPDNVSNPMPYPPSAAGKS